MGDQIEVETAAELRYQMRCRVSDMEAEIAALRSRLADAEVRAEKVLAWAETFGSQTGIVPLELDMTSGRGRTWWALGPKGRFCAETKLAAILKAAGVAG